MQQTLIKVLQANIQNICQSAMHGRLIPLSNSPVRTSKGYQTRTKTEEEKRSKEGDYRSVAGAPRDGVM